MKDLKLDEKSNKDIKVELFGTNKKTEDRCDHIAGKYGLKYETGNSFFEEGKTIVSWGIK